MKSILLFIGGMAVGAIAGILGTKKYFQKKYEDYYNLTDAYARHEHDDDKPEAENSAAPRMTNEERKEIKKELNKAYGRPTNYAKMYKDSDDPADSEHPLDQGEEGETNPEDLRICANCCWYNLETEICKVHNEKFSADDECSEFEKECDISPDEEAFDFHQRNKDRPPRIISEQAYGELPAYIECATLYFYAYDETLADENDDEITDPERLIGDALTKYDFIDSNERIIFVLNYEHDTCYEIQKLNASWTESH